MKYSIQHKTDYHYLAPVIQSHHILHLSPRNVDHQTILSHTLDIDPAPASQNNFTDYNGNPTSLITIEKEHSDLSFFSTSEIEILGNTPKDITSSPSWEDIAQAVYTSNDLEVLKYSCLSQHTQLNVDIFQYAQKSFIPNRSIHEVAMDLTSRIFNEFQFDNTATDISTPISEVLRIKRGVCQDFAHLQIACLRAMRLPVRYVSGYILTHPPEGLQKLTGTDASHAWISVWCGNELGWIDFDPTNNIIPTNEHITIAYGLDYDDISPIGGVLIGGGDHTVSVAVDVVAIK
ncbi:MAG: transglutaminase family protein [Pseudomonadota bacterium]